MFSNFVPFFGFVPVIVFIVAVILIAMFTNKVKPQIKDDAKKDEEQNTKPFVSKKMSEEDVKKAKTVGTIFLVIALLWTATILIGMVLSIVYSSGNLVDWFFFAPIVVVFLTLGLILINAKAVNEKTSSAIDKIQEKNNSEKEKPVYRCDYCGARLEDCDKRCPGCGARRKVKKD